MAQIPCGIIRPKCNDNTNCTLTNNIEHTRCYHHDNIPTEQYFTVPPPNIDSIKQQFNNNKPVCKYGDKCYRKNKEHFEQYTHPPKQNLVSQPNQQIYMTLPQQQYVPIQQVKCNLGEKCELTDYQHLIGYYHPLERNYYCDKCKSYKIFRCSYNGVFSFICGSCCNEYKKGNMIST